MRSIRDLGEARLGRLLVAIGLVGFGVENILFGRYIVARHAPWPTDSSAQLLVGYVTAAVLLAGGVAFLTGRFMRVAGLASAALILGWALVLHLPVAMASAAWSNRWTSLLKAVALASGVFAVAVADGRPMGPVLSALRTLAPFGAGAFFLLGGIQHLLFTPFVATLMPPFIPGAIFWTRFAGLALIAAGLGFWAPFARPVAARLTAAMVFSWVFLVHIPLVFRIGSAEWLGVVEALCVSGVCLVLARWPRQSAAVPPRNEEVDILTL